jgi:thioredoxin-related protein
MKRLVLLLAFLSSAFVTRAQEASAGSPVKWMSFEEAIERSKTEKRKIFIDVYTDWCGWCKVMDKNTFSEPAVAKVLNEKFYPVKFDAEGTKDVEFAGRTFKFIPSGNKGVHELAVALLNNQLSYPTVVFLDEEFRMIQPVPGYQKAPEFHRMIQFIGEDYYKKMKWADFHTVYKSPYGDTPGSGSGN